MTKTRDLQQIALDMYESLLKYSSNYQGSPYKEETDLITQEYNNWVRKECHLNIRTFSTWSSLEAAIQEILFDDRFSLSEINDMTAEILRAVKRLGLGWDIDDKLDRIISLAENLKTSNNSIS
jgi:hypothetical protein